MRVQARMNTCCAASSASARGSPNRLSRRQMPSKWLRTSTCAASAGLLTAPSSSGWTNRSAGCRITRDQASQMNPARRGWRSQKLHAQPESGRGTKRRDSKNLLSRLFEHEFVVHQGHTQVRLKFAEDPFHDAEPESTSEGSRRSERRVRCPFEQSRSILPAPAQCAQLQRETRFDDEPSPVETSRERATLHAAAEESEVSLAIARARRAEPVQARGTDRPRSAIFGRHADEKIGAPHPAGVPPTGRPSACAEFDGERGRVRDRRARIAVRAYTRCWGCRG